MTTIFYYSGTGNTLWTARQLSEQIGESQLVSISKTMKTGNIPTDLTKIGFMFPVYIWGVPKPVLDFIDSLKDISPEYCFAIAVNGGQVANTLIQLKKYLKKRYIALNAGFQIKTPSNYIPWGGALEESKQQVLFENAKAKINSIAKIINNNQNYPVEKGPLWQNILLSLIYKSSVNHVNKMDKSFWVDEKCNSCKICEQICPADNIVMVNGKPEWHQKCHQCLACLQWCPQEAIQYGKKTPKYKRYHHPEIKINDLL